MLLNNAPALATTIHNPKKEPAGKVVLGHPMLSYLTNQQCHPNINEI